MTPPWGVPVSDDSSCCPTRIPAPSSARIALRILRSTTRSASAPSNRSWSTSSKKLAMSASTTTRRPAQASSMTVFNAWCVERFGRNPKLHGAKSASKIGSSTIFNAACTTRSRTVGMPSGRVLPSGLGISTRRTGAGRQRPSANSAARSSRNGTTPASSTAAMVTPSTPAAPPLRATFTQALRNTSLRWTLS